MCHRVVRLRKDPRARCSPQCVMSIAHVLRTQLHQSAIDLVARNRAALDVDQPVRVAPKKSDDAILRVDRDAIAVSARFERRNNRAHRDLFEFPNSLENIAHLAPFNRKLMFVIDVLISASAAAAKVRTRRLDPIGRPLPHIDKFALGELFFLADDLRRDELALNRKRNKNGLAVVTSDSFSAERNVPDFKIDDAQRGMLAWQIAYATFRSKQFPLRLRAPSPLQVFRASPV